MFRKLGLSCSFDLLPHPLPPLWRVALLLFLRHEWPAYPVFILCFLLQAFNHIAFYLPGDNPRSTVLPNPLLSWDSLPQKRQSQEHPAASDGLQKWIWNKSQSSSATNVTSGSRKVQNMWKYEKIINYWSKNNSWLKQIKTKIF